MFNLMVLPINWVIDDKSSSELDNNNHTIGLKKDCNRFGTRRFLFKREGRGGVYVMIYSHIFSGVFLIKDLLIHLVFLIDVMHCVIYEKK